jgi:dGTPase
MAKTVDISKMRTVCKSLKAPIKLAIRPSGNSKGQTYRTVFMRDRDRVLYSKSFRRLAGKTQVYVSGNDDHKRTRLTHTLEVAQIAKTISNSLKLDLDLTEAIALGHDIGHTPFGHAGERTLHEIMTPCSSDSKIHKSPFIDTDNTNAYENYYGFKHNLQSVNVSLLLEKDYDDFGLDLTNFTLYGMNIHSSQVYKKGKNPDKLKYYNQFSSFMHLKDSSNDAWSFEAFVVKEADEIAQRHHDLEDAIRGNLISKDEVIKQIRSLFSEYFTSNDRGLLRTMKDTHDNEMYISLLSRLVVNLFVTQITKCSIYNLNSFILENSLTENNFPQYMLSHTANEVSKLIAYDKNDTSESFKDKMKSFESFLTSKVLSSYDIQTADAHGQYVIKKLFQAYYSTPAQLPDHCIIEYCRLSQSYTNAEIKEIISNKGMGELRSIFTNKLMDNQKKENQMYLMRVICNQIAGMTDSFAQKTYNDLYS